MDILHSIILGIIEGLTEFIPVSSTGHMILASKLMHLEQTEFLKSFEIIIQLGAIFAVVLAFKEKVFKDINLWKKLIVGFIPTGTIGFILYKLVKDLFNPSTVAYALIVWGIIFIIIEKFHKDQKSKINSLEEITYKQAIIIGISQCLAMVPGTSRSGATIMGSLLLGLNRKTASEFSFLLAIPTMMAATGYDTLKHYKAFNLENLVILIIGFLISFIVAFIVIKWFMNFIKNHTFIPFGIYRIVIGIIFLIFVL